MTIASSRRGGPTGVRLGLRENWPQFALLVTVNFFVGGLVGLERTVLPLVGTSEFGLTSELVTFSFIIAFGLVKAIANLAAPGRPPHPQGRPRRLGPATDAADHR